MYVQFVVDWRIPKWKVVPCASGLAQGGRDCLTAFEETIVMG